MKKLRSHTGRTAIVLAAGSGTRLGAGANKVWLPLGGRELATWSFRWLADTSLFDRFVIVVHPQEREEARDILLRHVDVPIDIVDGGSSRHDSETRALEYLAPAIESGDCTTVLIHDGARPLASPSLIRAVVSAAETHGGALPYLETAHITGEWSGERLIRVQTPQVFEARSLLDAYRKATVAGFEGSDTAMCLEQFRPDVTIMAVKGSAQNLKVTFPQDLIMAEHILSAQSFSLR
jgi:2-C-methyl-D-erythritol 4-phosphate cytidylyltransferase